MLLLLKGGCGAVRGQGGAGSGRRAQQAYDSCGKLGSSAATAAAAPAVAETSAGAAPAPAAATTTTNTL